MWVIIFFGFILPFSFAMVGVVGCVALPILDLIIGKMTKTYKRETASE